MPKNPKKPSAVREPVQVYLAMDDRALLDRVAKKIGQSRAEVLRRGVRHLAAEVLADDSPMLAFIHEEAAAAWPDTTPVDAAEQHDRYLTDPAVKKPAAARGRGAKRR